MNIEKTVRTDVWVIKAGAAGSMATIKASDYTKDIGVDHSASQTSNFLNCKGIHGLMDLFKDTASDSRIIRLALDKL